MKGLVFFTQMSAHSWRRLLFASTTILKEQRQFETLFDSILKVAQEEQLTFRMTEIAIQFGFSLNWFDRMQCAHSHRSLLTACVLFNKN
jgi:hypothetical protein